MLMIGVMTYGISSGWFDDVPKNAEEYTYTVGGSPQVGYLYHDTLPLYVQGLTDTDYARYSCEALERGDSVFVRQVEYRQELPYDVRWSDENDPPLPELFYTVIDVKPALRLLPPKHAARRRSLRQRIPRDRSRAVGRRPGVAGMRRP